MTKQQRKRRDNDPLIFIARKIANFIAQILVKTPLTPNQITFFSFIIFTPVIVYLLSQGKYLYNLIALGLIIITCTIDLCDGLVARIKGMPSKFGAWLDSSLDKIFHLAILVAIIIGLSQGGRMNTLLFITSLIMLAGQAMADFLGLRFETVFGFDVYRGSQIFKEKFAGIKKISWLDSYFKNIIVPSNLIYIFLFTTRYLMSLGILFNRLDIFIIIFGLTINIRWLSMYFLYLRYLSEKPSRLKTISFLKELEKNY